MNGSDANSCFPSKCSCILELHQKIGFSIFSRLTPDRGAQKPKLGLEGASKTDGGKGEEKS